ncbi:histone H4 transcription factor-like isoform X1 [Carassius carassius]|uniref:histone H4 transcription factor-like isoform X1 n=1 Tax=Carassius carassius TaxID=217509 RepID=UPI0028689545|nr:histone H4 transcription factor-like isoform X1 [Carassius carassius]XP_059370527.1 histone H4 transcription factor-like isoform X1 [Carassius carassius]
MAKRKNVSKIVVACEWASCTFKSQSTEELSDHMSLHLKEHLGDGDAMEELEDYPCLWRGCEFLAMGNQSELIAHAHFHIFHSKLKYIGAQLLESHPELPSCTQDLHSSSLVPDVSEGFVCQWQHCDSSFNNPEWFYRHVDMHTDCTELQPLPDRQQALFCSWSGCDAFFKIKYRLREHLRSHTQERLVACPTCGCMFSSNTKFFDHIQRQAEPEDSLTCGHCDKAFANERLLRDHVRQHVNHIKCPLCDMTCTSLSTLKIHIKFRHCDERPFPCDFCESSFKNQHDLRRHMETHNEGAAYHCTVEGCGYSSRMAHTMSQHFKRVHEQNDMVPRYKCHLCDKTFSWCYTLTLHLRKKHQLKWPSGHSRFRYKKDEDGYLRLNMVRYETVEVTEELIKNMAVKRTPRKVSGSTSHSKEPMLHPDSGNSTPQHSSSPSSPSSSSSTSELLEGTDSSGFKGDETSVYCVLNTVTEVSGDPEEVAQPGGPSVAVRALAAVARGLGMDVV